MSSLGRSVFNRAFDNCKRAALLNKRGLEPWTPRYWYSSKTVEDRYREKLLETARSKGFKTIEELKANLKDELEARKQKLNRIDPLKELEAYEQRTKMAENNAKAARLRGPVDASTPRAPFKTLDSYLDVEKIRQLSKQEVEFLWRARWMNKDGVLNAVVPVDVFERMSGYARANPAFVLPLQRDATGAGEEQGGQPVEMHYVQWQFVGPKTVHCIITSLAEFKLHKEFARPHSTFQFHLELADQKKVVFMNGQIESDSNVTLQDAQLLLLNVQRFYGAMGDATQAAKQRIKILQDFTAGSVDFKVDDLIALAQSLET
ncbi:ADL179Cp [Eremothecium gossypii ATCC 10895]|uniref:ADL179Cp n=1 Tax=Eremothecium gossypii (strain ATCC 10895 / CBS 109.51 / FGSC 9923 / NRRL Y-1056) TaxID=284811 RepID=Q75AU9_EREGS|nr:ADL179Cp [Eremothecium gossypii ATCC 10895]AAS51741.2 ADL179Cp [Eremothecium gossypii ATCC 10895]AEY96038.1 FADL179Cp [Eremothecium gossypii FDAG1]